MVTEEFDQMHKQIQETRSLCVHHAGVLRPEVKMTPAPPVDHEALFWSDPMTKLKKFAEVSGLRLVDLFRQFDKDNSWSINKEEFTAGVRVCSLENSSFFVKGNIKKCDKSDKWKKLH